jgi:hypothetical protein
MARKALRIEAVADSALEDKFIRLFQKRLLLSFEKRGLITKKRCRSAMRLLEGRRP